jgi:hypothetical protein
MIVLSACIAMLPMMLLNVARLDRAMAWEEAQPAQHSSHGSDGKEEFPFRPGKHGLERIYKTFIVGGI